MLTSPPLSQRLRQGTRKAHRAVENLAFLRSFLRGVVSLNGYVRYLIDLEHVYMQLEQSLCAHPAHDVLRPLILPELWREPCLRADIAFFSARVSLPPTPSASARRYGNRLRSLCVEDPQLLVAHAYTRYLGDLSGGQILRRIAARALRLHGNAGLSFYEFPQIDDVATFKASYRARLDSLPIDEALAQRIVAEANAAFALNGAILKELSGSAALSLWRLLVPDAFSSLESV